MIQNLIEIPNLPDKMNLICFKLNKFNSILICNLCLHVFTNEPDSLPCTFLLLRRFII